MAKQNNKSGKKSAAEQAAAKQAAPEVKGNASGNTSTPTNETKVAVIQLGDLDKIAQSRALAGLDPNHTVDLLKMMHETYRLDPKAAEHIGIAQETVDKINRITAIGQVAALTNEIALAQTPFAVAMRVTQLEAIKEVAPLLGVNIDTKALPAPNEQGIVELPSTAVKISQEAKKAAAEERAAAAKSVITNPTEIQNEDQLKDSLTNILVKGNGSENFYDKVVTAINFYESYLSIQANKAEDKEEQLAALKKKSRVDFLTDIAHMLGRCPFTIGGMAKFMFEHTERTKNPVAAFCTFRNTTLNKKTGMPQIDDNLVADIVKVLIRWYADSEIQESNRVAASMEKDLELLKKDAKKNAKGIEQGTQKIAKVKEHIAAVEKVVTFTNVPNREIVDNFAEDYVNDSREGYKFARMMGSKIMDTYYPDVNPKKVVQDNLVHNLQQYMGVIFNLFLPTMQQLSDFSEANIVELKKIEEPAAEATTNDEEAKNA